MSKSLRGTIEKKEACFRNLTPYNTMLRTSILLFTVALALAVGLAVHFADDRPVLYTYTGTHYCKGCHASTAAGEIFQVWQATAHASARNVLDSALAQEYFVKNGGDRQSCLGCHSTLGRAGLNDHERKVEAEGVGCERCHGPGSEYSQTVIMKDKEAFMRSGGSPGSLQNCYSCHAPIPNDETPHCPFQTAEFNAEAAWPTIAHPVKASRSWFDPFGIHRQDSTQADSAEHGLLHPDSASVDSTLQDERSAQ